MNSRFHSQLLTRNWWIARTVKVFFALASSSVKSVRSLPCLFVCRVAEKSHFCSFKLHVLENWLKGKKNNGAWISAREQLCVMSFLISECHCVQEGYTHFQNDLVFGKRMELYKKTYACFVFLLLHQIKIVLVFAHYSVL